MCHILGLNLGLCSRPCSEVVEILHHDTVECVVYFQFYKCLSIFLSKSYNLKSYVMASKDGLGHEMSSQSTYSTKCDYARSFLIK